MGLVSVRSSLLKSFPFRPPLSLSTYYALLSLSCTLHIAIRVNRLQFLLNKSVTVSEINIAPDPIATHFPSSDSRIGFVASAAVDVVHHCPPLHSASLDLHLAFRTKTDRHRSIPSSSAAVVDP